MSTLRVELICEWVIGATCAVWACQAPETTQAKACAARLPTILFPEASSTQSSVKKALPRIRLKASGDKVWLRYKVY